MSDLSIHSALAASSPSAMLASISPQLVAIAILVGLIVAVFVITIAVVNRLYVRCPSNKILVVYGKTKSGKASECYHGGGCLVVPFIQSYAFLSLEPLIFETTLEGEANGGGMVRVLSKLSVGISTQPESMERAAERLLMLTRVEIQQQAEDLFTRLWREMVESSTVEQIRADRSAFRAQLEERFARQLEEIGLTVVSADHDVRLEPA